MATSDKISQATATAVSLFLSGAICSVSMIAVPAALTTQKSNDALLQQWKTIYLSGHKQGPAIAIAAGITYGAVAYVQRSQGDDPTFSIIAALFTVAIMPYTWVTMLPTNRFLEGAANMGIGVSEARKMVGRWRWMNWFRGVLPFIGGVVSIVGMAKQ